jgi:hypothetical protein
MVRAQYLPENQLAKIPGAFYGSPVLSPLSSGATRVFEDLRYPGDKTIEFDDELLRAVIAEGLSRYPGDNNTLDQWLAPRIHSVVRVPRRIASDRRFWAWVAIEFGRDYTKHRFSDGGAIKEFRFTGTHLRNGIARLWWAAELARNGRDYGPVAQVLKAVRIAQFALELKYSWYRPAVIAFATVSADRKLTDQKMQALSVRVNAYLGTRPVELVGLDETGSVAYDAEWWASAPPSKKELFDGKLEGPDDGTASPDAIERLVKWFGVIIDELESTPAPAPARDGQ